MGNIISGSLVANHKITYFHLYYGIQPAVSASLSCWAQFSSDGASMQAKDVTSVDGIIIGGTVYSGSATFTALKNIFVPDDSVPIAAGNVWISASSSVVVNTFSNT